MSLPTEWGQCHLSEVTVPTSKWNPRRDPCPSIRYIDVSAVSRDELRIISEATYSSDDAPSRARKIVKTGDTIFATIRPTLRRIAQIPPSLDNGIVSTAFCVLRPDPQVIDANFLYFATQLESVIKGIAGMESGASYPAVRDVDVLDQVVPLPPLPEQREIATVLNTIRTALLHQTKCEENVIALKRAAMHTLFTHGLRGEAQKETEIGPIPESWEIRSVAEAVRPFRFERKQQVPKSEYAENGRWPIIDQGQDFIGGYVDDETRLISSAAPIIIFGDHTRIFKFVDFEFALGAQGTKPLLAKDGFNSKYLYYALCNLDIPPRGYNRHYKILSQMHIGKPDPSEQREIVTILNAIDRKIDLHRRKRTVLDDLFNALLHKLMTGEIRAGDLDLSALQSTHDSSLKLNGNNGK